MSACSNKAVSREVTATTVPSPKSGNASRQPRSHERSTVPQGTHDVHSREAGTKAPQHASFPSSSSTKLALRTGAKGLSLSADSVAYAASAPKGFSKLLAAKLEPKHYLRLIAFAAA